MWYFANSIELLLASCVRGHTQHIHMWTILDSIVLLAMHLQMSQLRVNILLFSSLPAIPSTFNTYSARHGRPGQSVSMHTKCALSHADWLFSCLTFLRYTFIIWSLPRFVVLTFKTSNIIIIAVIACCSRAICCHSSRHILFLLFLFSLVSVPGGMVDCDFN